MVTEDRVSIYELVQTISELIDLASPALSNHHKRVAYIAGSIADRMDMPGDEMQDIILASMLHDIGAFSIHERIYALSFDCFDVEIGNHAQVGYKLLKCFDPLKKAASLILDHHTPHNIRRGVPLGSSIIHLADRASVTFDENYEILAQISKMFDMI